MGMVYVVTVPQSVWQFLWSQTDNPALCDLMFHGFDIRLMLIVNTVLK